MSKCTCVYATSENTAAVRAGIELGGYIKQECERCKRLDAQIAATPPRTVFQKVYDGESICDLSRDISEAFDERFNPAVAGIPEIEDGMGIHAGSFKVTVEWTPE